MLGSLAGSRQQCSVLGQLRFPFSFTGSQNKLNIRDVFRRRIVVV